MCTAWKASLLRCSPPAGGSAKRREAAARVAWGRTGPVAAKEGAGPSTSRRCVVQAHCSRAGATLHPSRAKAAAAPRCARCTAATCAGARARGSPSPSRETASCTTWRESSRVRSCRLPPTTPPPHRDTAQPPPLAPSCRHSGLDSAQVGVGCRSASSIEQVLAAADRVAAGPTAPAAGLCLEHVEYERPWGGERGASRGEAAGQDDVDESS
mmetsp:Transcript_16075/g.54136  ORF Transcript_16075/g.54136 Transcript_16075/m.54136 type:complete len:212 (-) Transcript_16075:184-819(-)